MLRRLLTTPAKGDTASSGRRRRGWRHLGCILFNTYVTYVPIQRVRVAFLGLWGAQIGRRTTMLRGTTVFGIEHISIGDECAIGFRCMLDGRGGLRIADRVVVASDVHFITARHDITAPDFAVALAPIEVHEYAWITSRATIDAGVTVGRGAVVGACALVTRDVAPLTVVGGVPAKQIGTRPDVASYSPAWRPWGF